MSTSAVLGCSNNQTKNEDKSFFRLPTILEIKKTWLNAINCKEGNLPHKVVVSSDHFEEQCFDCSWRLHNELYYSDRLVKRKLGRNSNIFTLSEPQRSTRSTPRA